MRRMLVLSLTVLLGLWGCGGEETPQSSHSTRSAPPPPPPPAAVPSPPETRQPEKPEAAPSPEVTQPKEAPAKEQPVPESGPRQEKPAPEDAEASQRRSLENLRKIAAAMLGYHETKKRFPPSAILAEGDKPMLSWRVQLLPLLGQEELFKQFHLDEPWDGPNNRPLLAKIPAVYQTPQGPSDGRTCYLLPKGLGTIYEREGMSRHLIVDGADKTVLIVECNEERAVPWTKPEDYRYVPASPTSGLIGLRGEGFLAAFADGASRRLNLALGDTFIRGLFSSQGREPVDVSMLDAKPEVQLTIVPPGFLKDARQELASGKQKSALQYLLAEAVVRSTPQVMDSVRWSPALKRPVLMVRWGLMMQGQFPAPRPGTPGAQAAQQARQFWAGAVGQPLFEQFEQRFNKGTFGTWLKEAVSAAPGSGFGPPQVAVNSSMESRGRPTKPGVASKAPPAPPQPSTQGRFTLLTAAEPTAARREALKEGLDAILIVAVIIKGGKMREGVFHPISNCTLKVQDVLKGDIVWTSKPAVSGEGGDTDAARQAAGKDLLTETRAYIDQAMALKPVPSLTPDDVRARVESVTTGQQPNPLLSLMEIRYYEYKKLLKATEVAEAFAKIAGPEDGPRLASGPEDQRKQIVQRWLGE